VSNALLRSLTAKKTSHLVHMLERGNDGHRHNVASSSMLQPEMIRWANMIRCCPTSAAPPRPLLFPRYSEHSDSEEEESSEDCIQDPVAGGRICRCDATATVYAFASTAATKPFPSPLFDFKTQSSATAASPVYTCTVVAPGTPAHDVSGQPCSSMVHARRSACYNVCVKLAESGFLDPKAFLFPSRGPGSSRMHNTEELTYGGDQVYPRQAPLFWSHPAGAVVSLFPTIITVNHSNQSPHAPILLLTRQPLPEFPSFKLFLSGTPITAQTYRGAPFSVDNERHVSLHMYTLRLCRAVANKPFSCSLEEMPYFLAPVSSTWVPPRNTGPWERSGQWERSDVAEHIPWDAVAYGALPAEPLKYGRPKKVAKDIEDAVIQDRSTELTRRYDVLRVRPDLSPLSHPEDSPVSCRDVLFV
jgi:endoribonuclease Dicer